MSELGAGVGRRLRALREQQGLSLSALARRAALGKGTLSELESGRRNPTLETLFALTTALGLPLSAALPSESAAPDAVGAAVDAWLVERAVGAEVFRLRVRTGQEQRSAPHAQGVREQVLVVAGRLRLGPDGVELGPGQSLDYPGDVPHVWAAQGQDASAVLVMRYPDSSATA
jgi:transcriptional regulator with XRE-family HTH domain